MAEEILRARAQQPKHPAAQLLSKGGDLSSVPPRHWDTGSQEEQPPGGAVPGQSSHSLGWHPLLSRTVFSDPRGPLGAGWPCKPPGPTEHPWVGSRHGTMGCKCAGMSFGLTVHEYELNRHRPNPMSSPENKPCWFHTPSLSWFVPAGWHSLEPQPCRAARAHSPACLCPRGRHGVRARLSQFGKSGVC